jgi:peptidyl-prolyl cis-trans isomerase D
MLDFMRKKAGSWMIKFILGVIIVVFVFWGVGSFRDSNVASVASVNGETIPLDTYRESYNLLLEQTRQRFGNNLNDDLLKALNLRKQALDRLIDQALWSQEASKLGIQVSDEEVAAAISGIQVFQNAGVFDPRRYQAVLSQNRLTAEQFEAMQKKTMLIEKLNRLIAGGVMVSDDEAEQWYQWNDTSLQIEYVAFDPATFKNIELTPGQIQAYYEEHRENYKSEEQLKALYIRISPDDFRNEVAVSEERITEYYDTHLDEFKVPKTVEARHILLKVDPTADPETVETKRLEAEDLMNKAKSGYNFAELAASYSEGPTRDRGGLLGAFRREDMVKPFADAAFAMKAGEISQPVKTQFGWHVIKVEAINEAETRTLEEVREEITDRLATVEAKNIAYDEAVAVYDNTIDGQSLAETTGIENMEIHSTELFGRAGPAGLSNPSGFAQAAFKLGVNEISGIEDLGDANYIIQVTEKIPAAVQPIAAVQPQVEADLLQHQQEQAAEAAAREFLEAMKSGAKFEDLAASAGLSISTSGFFKRADSGAGSKIERSLSDAAFELNKDNPFPAEPVKGRDRYYAFQLKSSKTPDPEAFAKDKAETKKDLLRRKQNKTFQSWLAKIRAGSEISIQEGFIE